MVIRWLLAFTLSLQVTFAIAAERTDYRDFTPEKRQQVTDRWNASFNKVGKDIGYARDYASGKMDTVVKQINQNHEVRTQIRDSGYDPDTGKRIRIEANVTQAANKAKVASTLTDRLKKAADFAKKSGKASIPAFVGGAAVQALVDGVGWVMDEGGKVTKKPVEDGSVQPNHQYVFRVNAKDCGSTSNCDFSTVEAAGSTFCANYNSTGGYKFSHAEGTKIYCFRSGTSGSTWHSFISKVLNPNYDPSAPLPENVEVTPEQLAEALKNALESNNPALAAAIAQAIKDAYTPEGKLASIGDEQANGLAVDAADTARDAVNKAAKNTGSEPSSKGKPGYYNITDGDKTIEGNVYETDPTGSITPKPDTGTGTEPGTGTGTGTSTGGATLEFPVFCEWAGIVCDFIDWVKQDEEIPEDEPEKIDESIFDRKFDINFDIGGSCPPNPTWSFEFVGQQWSKEINISSICDFFRYIGYAIVFASNMTALWIVYAAVTVREQG